MFSICALAYSAKAQENLNGKLQVNGFIQTEFEWVQWEGKSNNGSPQVYDPERDMADNDYFIRYGVRRGGIRLAYNQEKVQGIFELDLNDGGLYPKAAIINYRPWDFMEINAGLQTVWFGEEVSYPTPKQEVLEHCDLLRNLFFLDRDLGLKISLNSPKNWAINGLRLDLGFVSGNNINKVSDGRLNFVGHLKYKKTVNDIYFGIGTSVFAGKVHNMFKQIAQVANAYAIPSPYDKVITDEQNVSRTYFGIDAQLKFHTSLLGTTEIKTEYIWGTHPSQQNSFRSPNNNEYSQNPEDMFCFARHFSGGYVYLFQDIKNLPVRLLAKYTFMNPDNDVSSEEKLYAADVNYQTIGFGCEWNITKGLRLTGIYNMNINEKCATLPLYSYDRKDNHFTLRLQYEF